MSGFDDMIEAYVNSFSASPKIFTAKESAMSPIAQELRLQCVELAIKASQHPDQVVPIAESLLAFVTGNKTPREAIDAALDQAGVR